MLPDQVEPDLKRFFRILLLTDFGLTLLAIAVSWIDSSLLPSDLEKYKSEFAIDAVSLSLIGGFLGLYCVIMVGLWKFKRWARVLYSLVALLSAVSALFLGDANVESALSASLSAIASMATGATLVFIWLVMRREFARPVLAGNSQLPPGSPSTRDQGLPEPF